MESSAETAGTGQGERFRRLIEVGTDLLSELDLESVLRSVVEAARELTGAQYAALGVLDSERRELERFIYLGIDEPTRRSIGPLPRGRGVLGELIREPAPLRLRDVNAHHHAYGFPPGHPPMRSFLGVPISVRGAVYGNLYMTEKQGAEEFDEADEDSAKTLAVWAGIAIENARLYTSLSEREEETERALRRAETSADIAMTIGGETDVDRVLDLIVKRGRALVDARALLVFLRRGDRLVLAASAGATGEVEEIVIPADDRVFASVVDDRVARHLDADAPPSEAHLRERLGAETALIVPLLFRGHAVGALVALDREGGAGKFDQEAQRLLQAFAASAATAVATAQGVEAERLQQRVEIGESERRRWAQELHDDALQGLAAIRISLATALHSSPEGRPERVEAAAEDTLRGLESQINELSRLINDLRPASLERLGLSGALEAMAEEWGERGGFAVETSIDVDTEYMTGGEERAIYRFVQEALNNVVKHAAAEQATVSATMGDDHIRVAVHDDGAGFEIGSVERGHGLNGMRERIELLGGEIDIRSKPDEGTKVTARVPVRVR